MKSNELKIDFYPKIKSEFLHFNPLNVCQVNDSGIIQNYELLPDLIASLKMTGFSIRIDSNNIPFTSVSRIPLNFENKICLFYNHFIFINKWFSFNYPFFVDENNNIHSRWITYKKIDTQSELYLDSKSDFVSINLSVNSYTDGINSKKHILYISILSVLEAKTVNYRFQINKRQELVNLRQILKIDLDQSNVVNLLTFHRMLLSLKDKFILAHDFKEDDYLKLNNLI